MKRVIKLMLLFLLILLFSGCVVSTQNNQQFYIDQINTLVVNVGEKIELTNIQYDTNTNILKKNFVGVIANEVGEILVNSSEGQYYIIVKEEEIVLNAQVTQLLYIGDQTTIETLILPNDKNQDVSYTTTDSSVISVTNEGKVKALSVGIASIKIESINYDICKELVFVVLDEDEKYYDSIINTIINSENIYLDSEYSNLINGIINYNINSLIGVSTYYVKNNKIKSSDFGSGIIYKMNIHYSDGSVKENVTSIENETNIKEFEYYVITNRHLITDKNLYKIYIGDDYEEIDAELIEYDDKIDLAVLKFSTKYYFPSAKFGNSDDIEKGEFIVSIGNGTAKDYFRSSTFGIISSTKRYVTTDTDEDNVNDWDSEYIQHDASINECDSGGAIMNLQGEIIGINSTKISSTTYNNMSFAIPINLVMEIVSQLEQGIRPKRATLGVQILDVSGYWENQEYYNQYYPTVKVPDGVKYGFYVTVVDKGGVAEKAGIQINDIIIEFNNVEIKYSYQVRAELGKFLIGSGEIAEIKVIRNGEIITLSVEF